MYVPRQVDPHDAIEDGGLHVHLIKKKYILTKNTC